jgi:hypothetical protein
MTAATAEEDHAAAVEPHVGPVAPARRPKAPWALVGPEGIDTEDQLAGWVCRAAVFL